MDGNPSVVPFSQSYRGPARRIFTFQLSKLSEGMSYTFRLGVSAADGREGYTEITLPVNPAPSAGSLEVWPSRGYAMETLFTLQALNWVETDPEHYPLSYRFTLDNMASLGASTTSPTLENVYLPPGSSHLGGNLTVYVFVADVFGACCANGESDAGIDSVRVLVPDSSISRLANTLSRIDQFLTFHDSRSALQLLVSAASTLGFNTRNTRRLLTSSDPVEVNSTAWWRGELLHKLWDIYEASDVSESSLSSVLNGIYELISPFTLWIPEVTMQSAARLASSVLYDFVEVDGSPTEFMRNTIVQVMSGLVAKGSVNESLRMDASNFSKLVEASVFAMLSATPTGVSEWESSEFVDIAALHDQVRYLEHTQMFTSNLDVEIFATVRYHVELVVPPVDLSVARPL